jgi:hypothetical protein
MPFPFPRRLGIRLEPERPFVRGQLLVRLYDEHGNLKEVRHLPNLVVDTGFDNLVRKVVLQHASGIAGAQHIATGSGSTAPAATDTRLQFEIDRISASYSEPASKQARLTAVFGPGRSIGPISEAGVFNSPNSGAGVLLARQTFAVVNKASADTLQIDWTFTFS